MAEFTTAKTTTDSVEQKVTDSKNELFLGHSDSVTSVAYSPKGTLLVSGSLDKTVRISNVKTGEVLQIWDISDGETKECIGLSSDEARTTKYVRLSSEVNCVAFSSDDVHVASGSSDSFLHIFNVESGEKIKTFDIPLVQMKNSATGDLEGTINGFSPVTCVNFSPDGTQIVSGTGGGDNSVYVWDIATGKKVMYIKGHTGCGIDQLTNGMEGHGPKWWGEYDETGVKGWKNGWCGAEIQSVAFFPDGKRVISSSLDNTVRIWEVATGTELRRFTPEPKGSDKYDGFVDFQGTNKLHEVFGKEEMRKKLTSNHGRTQGRKRLDCPVVALSPDGKTFISVVKFLRGRVTQGCPLKWDIDSENMTKTDADAMKFQIFTGGVNNSDTSTTAMICFSPDGKLVAGSAGFSPMSKNPLITVWNAATGKIVWTETNEIIYSSGMVDGSGRASFEGKHTAAVNCVAFSPDSQKLVSASKDGTICVWDITTFTDGFNHWSSTGVPSSIVQARKKLQKRVERQPINETKRISEEKIAQFAMSLPFGDIPNPCRGDVPNAALADHWSMLATRFDWASAETFDQFSKNSEKSVGVYEHGYAAQMFCNRMYGLVNRNYGHGHEKSSGLTNTFEEYVCCPNAPNAQLTITLLNAAQRLIDTIYWKTRFGSHSSTAEDKRYNALLLDGDFACGRNEPLARFGTQLLKEFQLVSKKKYEDKMGMVESGIPIEDVDRLLKASDYNVDNAMTLWQKERMVMVESGVLIEDVDRLLKASDYNIDNALTLWQKEKEAEIAKKKETDAALAALADPFGRDEVGDGDY